MVAEQGQSSKSQTPITGTYSSPVSRYYRLKGRDDIVPRDELPYEFVDSDKRVTSSLTRAFAPDGPATALFAKLADSYLFTVYGAALGVPERYRHARCIRSKKALSVWRDALKKHFAGCYLFKFEVGLDDDELHVHVVADKQAGLSELVRGSEQCKPVTDKKGVIRYLKKPPVYATKKRHKEYLRAKKRVGDGKLPEVSGYERLPSKPERLCQSTFPETPSQTQEIEIEKSSYIYRALPPSHPRPLTFERFERVMFPGAGGTFSQVWVPSGPPARGSP